MATRRDNWRETFVASRQEGRSVADAAAAAGVHRSTVYRERDRNPAFAEQMAAAPAGSVRPPTGKGKGRSGTVNTGGYLEDREFNLKLAWPQGLDVYEEMRRSESSVRWMLALVTTPLRAAEQTIEPASQDPEDLEVAAFVEHALFEELDGGWDETLRQMLTYFDFGHAAFERIARLTEVEFTYEVERIVYDRPDDPDPLEQPGPGEDDQGPPPTPPPPPETAAADAPPVVAQPPQVLDPADGKVKPMPGVTPAALAPHLAAPGQAPPKPKPKPRRERTERTVKREAFVIGRLAPRLQRTIQKWNPVPGDSSRLASIEQWLADGQDPATVEIDADRLVVLTHEKEGDDWRGVSLLRPAYKAYRFKAALENVEAIAFERSAGLPVAYPPEDADDADLDAVEAAIRELRQGEQLYIVMPGPKAGTTDSGDGWLLEDLTVSGDGGKAPDMSAAISRYDAEMARNVLAEFMRLGHEQTGARATGDVQQDPYYQALEAHAGYLEGVINAALIRPLVDWNYEVSRYPRLKFSKLQAKNIAVVAEALNKLAVPGLVAADPELENWSRRLLDAPERPLELSDEAPPAPPETPPPEGKEDDPGEGPGPGEAGGDDEPMTYRFAAPGFSSWRPIRAEEEAVAFAQIADGLTNATDDVVELAAEILAGQARSQGELADRAVELNRPEMLDDVTFDPAPLADAIAQRLEDVYREGRAHVRAELRRQDPNGDAETAALRIPLSVGERLRAIRQIAQTAAEEAAAQATRAVKTGALRRITSRTDPEIARPGADPLAAARQAIREAASGLVNRAFSLGRDQELRELAGRFNHYVYTAILDEACCGPCEDADGSTAATAEEMEPPAPNPECEGGDRCRCLWLGYLSAGGGSGGGVGFG